MIYYTDANTTLHHGDALQVARELPDGAADCIVTSPPYFNQRDYGIDGQYGLEATVAEYVERLRVLFFELYRVLADDGTLWIVIGDSYSAGGQGGNRPEMRHHRTPGKPVRVPGFAPKNRLNIPHTLVSALQADGWIWRSGIVWVKGNALPESVTDRPSNRHEDVLMFAKRQKYWFDLDPIRVRHTDSSIDRRDASRRRRSSTTGKAAAALVPGSGPQSQIAAGLRELHPAGANPGDVWEINTQPFPGAHFAVMPVKLAQRCILGGCAPRRCAECGHVPEPIIEKGDLVTTWPGQRNLLTQIDAAGNPDGVYSELDFRGGQGGHAFPRRERTTTGYTDCGHNAYQAGVVLDPFSGSGTTGLAALRTGRRYIGVDLNQEYLDLSLRTRLRDMPLDFETGA
jgi:DNA modification methylase